MNDALVHTTLSRTAVLFNDLHSVTSILFVCKLIFSTLSHHFWCLFMYVPLCLLFSFCTVLLLLMCVTVGYVVLVGR